MADRPEGKAGDPEPKAKPDRAGEGAVDDRKAARRAAEQDRLGERAVDRREETRNVGLLCHQTSAPPPKEKKERKKLDAAKAIDRPKRSEEHTSELQALMRSSYADFCLKKKKTNIHKRKT